MDARSTSAEYEVAPVRDGDVAAVTAIERATFSDAWSARSFVEARQAPGAFLRCARETIRGEILGYVVALFVADEAQVLNLAVRDEARRRGIGAALLRETIDEARRRGAANMYLEVRESNGGARALYGGAGFAEIGRRRGYYQRPAEDAILLRRAVAP
jgi:ribosomal-protein-alanine N-acetyltransferase